VSSIFKKLLMIAASLVALTGIARAERNEMEKDAVIYATAALPSSVMKSRRLMSDMGLPPAGAHTGHDTANDRRAVARRAAACALFRPRRAPGSPPGAKCAHGLPIERQT
jgi:hypothetical protein